jgi:hypothetical protein
MIDLKNPELDLAIQGQSLAKVVEGTGSMERDYIVSESWSQAAIISKDYKLGIMLDPTDHKRQFDYREFGDMFFDLNKDPLEIKNAVGEAMYVDQIELLRSYYEEFKANYPDLGKQEIMRSQDSKN